MPGQADGSPERITQLAGLVERRGACHHPDGTARFVRSALVVFQDEVVAHQGGWCRATHHAPVLPTVSPR